MKPEELKPIKQKKASVKTSNEKEVELHPMEEKVPVKESNRKIKGDLKDYNTIKSEASSYGIDINDLPTNKTANQIKRELSDGVSKVVGEEYSQQTKDFINAIPSPQLEDLPTLDMKKQKELARKQRRVRWADALYAFGEGLQGRTANPNVMASTRLQRRRDQNFQNYKNAVERNRNIQNVWQENKRNEVMDWIQDKIDDTTLSAAEREKYKAMADQIAATNRKTALGEKELAARQNGSYYNTRQEPVYTQQLEDGSWQLSTGQTPYTDLLYSLTDNPGQLFPDTDGRRYSPDEKEDLAKQIISQSYQLSTDKNGNTIAKPIQGRENYIQQLPVKREIAQLDESISEAEQDFVTLESRYNNAKRSDKATLKAALDKSKQSLVDLKNRRKELNSSIGNTSTDTNNDTDKSHEYNSFWNGRKSSTKFQDIVKSHQGNTSESNTNGKLDAFFNNEESTDTKEDQ